MTTKDTLPWRLRDTPPTPEGALSKSQVLQLQNDYGFKLEDLRELSQKVNNALSPKLTISQPELSPARHKKGRKGAESAIKDLKAVERKLEKVTETLEDLRFEHPMAYVKVPNPAIAHLKEFVKGKTAIGELRSFLEVWAEQNMIFCSGVPDKRQIPDMRRTMICTAAFNLWQIAGRKLSYTTDPVTSERGGSLIDFTNAVVEYVTEPPSRLTGDAIKKELDDYKAFVAR